jgi:hypothetical protein
VSKPKKKGKAKKVKTVPKKGKKDQLPWKQFTGIEDNTGSSIPFVEVPGPSRRAHQATTILDIFKLFIPITLVQSWVDETNRYAAVLRTRKPSSMKWVDVSLEELFAYIGMVIAMGLVNLPSVLDYFATEPILSHPWFPSILSRDRFVLISRYFHVSDDTQFPGDKLGKLRTFIDHLVQSFQNHWTPHREISIDEQMIGTRCRVSFIQYMPKKPARFGVKNWVLADSIFPYVCNFQIYTGKNEKTPEHGLAHRVIMDLMEPYLNKGHRLFTDNFYSSPTLYEQLYEKKTLACGTVRQDRKGMPAELLKNRTPAYTRGQSTFLKHNNLTVVRWKDKRDVFALSTFHGNACNDELPHKPAMIASYNKFMNGVDRADQLLSYYCLNKKSRKWWKKVFWRLLEMCITNVYQIRKFKDSKVVHKQLRLSLAYSLCQPLLDLRVGGGPRSSLPGPGRPPADLSRLKGKHFATGAKKGGKRGRCKVCGSKKTNEGKRRDTKTANKCVQCNIFLCEGVCFTHYHTKAQL